MSMTKRESIAKREIEEILASSGYVTYSHLLDEFDVNLTQDPKTIAYMIPNKGVIVINEGLNLQQISVVVRHEILHQYLKHEQRLLQHLAKSKGLNYSKLEDLSLEELQNLKNTLYSNDDFNIAADYEISNRAYTDADKQYIRKLDINGKILSGLVTEDDHKDWVDMSVEQMYDELKKLKNQEQNDMANDMQQDDSESSGSQSDDSDAKIGDQKSNSSKGPSSSGSQVIHGRFVNGRFIGNDGKEYN